MKKYFSIIAFVFAIVVAISFSSCTSCSRSGRASELNERIARDSAPLEKVVIINHEIIGYGNVDRYKVKRLESSTVCFIMIAKTFDYEKNDTILWKFSERYQ